MISYVYFTIFAAKKTAQKNAVGQRQSICFNGKDEHFDFE